MKKEKSLISKIAWGLVAVLAFIIAFSLVSSLVGNQKSDDYVMPDVLRDSLKEKSSQANPKIIEKSVVDGCLEEAPGQRPYCQCAYDYLEKNIGISGIIDMSIEFDNNGIITKEVADYMADAVYYCLDNYIE